MKPFSLTVLCFATALSLGSCQSSSKEDTKPATSTEVTTNNAKKYVDENTYIDLDVDALAKEIANPQTRATVDNEKQSQMNAALYRFYSHVKLVDGAYTCDLTSAKDINVSARVYAALKNNLDDMNADIRKAKEAGEEIDTPEVDEAYLASLLK